MSETQDPRPDQKEKRSGFVPAKPLPRLWKTEPDDEEKSEKSLETPDGKNKKAKVPASDTTAPSKARSSSKKKSEKAKTSKNRPIDPETGEKRVLVEETPRFDTIESRQRARMAVGGLLAFCLLMVGWNIYYLLFPASDIVVVDVGPEPPFPSALPPGQPSTREGEATYMLDRARDYTRRDQVKPAIEMLKRVVAVYKGTRAATEARAALDRQRQNLPLFPTGPIVLAHQNAPTPSAPAGAGNTPPASGSPAATALTGRPPSPPGYSASAPPQTTMVGPAPQPVSPRVPAANIPAINMNPAVVGSSPFPAPTRSVPTPDATSTALVSLVPTTRSSSQSSMTPATGSSATGLAVSSGTTNPPLSGHSPKAPPGSGESAVIVPAQGAYPAAQATEGNTAAADRAPTTGARIVPRTLPPGYRAKPEAGLHESGWPLIIMGERDNTPMVLVPGATFMMGSSSGKAENGPAHAVHVSTFYIDKYEVTNRQFRTFLQETRYQGRPSGKWLTDAKMRSMPDDAPAVYVSYHDAEAYAMWALKRLPTEAQWELAARSVDGRRHPWGDQPPRWSRPRKFRQLDPVGNFPEDVSPFGVFDLAGNAEEWVRDWYDPRFYLRLRDRTTEDPTGPPTKRQGIQRSVRGASSNWLVYDRSGVDSDQRLPYLGFRCTLAVEGGEASAAIAPRDDRPATPRAPANTPDTGGALPF